MDPEKMSKCENWEIPGKTGSPGFKLNFIFNVKNWKFYDTFKVINV